MTREPARSIEAEEDAAAELLERRWFASMAAARSKQAECEALLEVMALAKASWHDSRAELLKLEALREALGEEMAERRALREEFERHTERIWSVA